MADVVQINQLGRVVGGKLRLGEFVRKPVGDGKFTSEFKMTRKTVALGNGVDLATDMPATKDSVWLNVTAAAAERLGWPHPANQQGTSEADIPRLLGIVGNPNYGQQEQRQAIRDIATVDVGLARQLQLQHAWLMEAV